MQIPELLNEVTRRHNVQTSVSNKWIIVLQVNKMGVSWLSKKNKIMLRHSVCLGREFWKCFQNWPKGELKWPNFVIGWLFLSNKHEQHVVLSPILCPVYGWRLLLEAEMAVGRKTALWHWRDLQSPQRIRLLTTFCCHNLTESIYQQSH